MESFMHKIKQFLLTLTLLNLILEPVVFAKMNSQKSSSREAIETLSYTGNEQLFSTLWYSLRQDITPKERTFIDTWVLLNPDFKFPKSKIIKKSQRERSGNFKLSIQVDAETASIEFQNDKRGFAQVNGIKISQAESSSLNDSLAKLSKEKKLSRVSPMLLSKSPLSIDFPSFSSMKPYDKAVYFVNKRLLLESAQKVLAEKKKVAEIHSFKSLFILLMNGTAAQANSTHKCLDSAGFISEQNKDDGSCLITHRKTVGRYSETSCMPHQVSCNPILYGNVCGTSTPGETCAERSPLREQNLKQDAEALIKSILATQGKSSWEINQYFRGQNISQQQFEYLEEVISKDFNNYINEATKICEARSDKGETCNELAERRLNFNSYLVDLKMNRVDSTKSQSFRKRSEVLNIQNTEEECNWWCQNKGWAIPIGIASATLVGLCAFKKISFIDMCSKKKTVTAEGGSPIIDSTMTTTTVDASVLPVAPTAPDYTGVR